MVCTREAVILAGGFGTRLAHVVPDVCKPMAPVAGRPFLCHVLDQLDAAGFARVVIADGYRREQIEDYFGRTYRGLEVDYSPEDTPLFTGGAAKKALRTCSVERVFVLNGDTWLDINFEAMEACADMHPEPPAVIAAKRMRDFDRYGTLELSSAGEVLGFREKAPCEEGVINGGTYLLHRDALEGQPDVFSLESDYFEKVVGNGSVYACEAEGGFIDIGVPEDYEFAQRMFSDPKPCRLAMFDRDGTVNVDVGHLHCVGDLELILSTVDIMRRCSNDPAWKVVIVTNQAGIAKGMYSIDDMRTLHREMGMILEGLGVHVDGWYFCPHHPDFTGSCRCRKPAPGMLLRAMRDFGASPADCVMYGDKDTDRQAAEAAGVRFVGMQS